MSRGEVYLVSVVTIYTNETATAEFDGRGTSFTDGDGNELLRFQGELRASECWLVWSAYEQGVAAGRLSGATAVRAAIRRELGL